MKLKGIVKIDLTDVNTQEVKTVVEENMVTEVVNDVLGNNPMGMFYKAETNLDAENNWEGTLIPICPNMVGGILLFPSQLPEQTATKYAAVSNEPTGYASNDVNTTLDTNRGSMNQVESKEIEGGYRFVWEFTPSQGNGMISAVALTSKYGGKAYAGSMQTATTPFLSLKRIRLSASDDVIRDLMSGIVEIDFENDMIVSLRYENGTISIKKYQVPTFSLGLTDSLDGISYKLLSNTQITPSIFSFDTSGYTNYVRGIFLDGHDGYWYGFSNGTGNSSGNATVKWIKIKKEDNTFTEGTWTLTNVYLDVVGYWRTTDKWYRLINATLTNGYLYVMKYGRAGVYKINIANYTDVTEITFPNSYVPGETGIGIDGAGTLYSKTNIACVNDIVFGRGWRVGPNDTVIRTKEEGLFTYTPMSPVFQYKEFLFFWGSNAVYPLINFYLFTPYTASVCNLSGSVAKTADKMMKVTYELTEVQGE